VITLTNDQAGVNILTSQEILRTILADICGQDTADDIITGEVTIVVPGADTLVKDFLDIKAVYDASPETFVDTQQNIDDLDDVADAIVALALLDFAAESGDAYDALQEASPD
jgi:hypothetical protein